MSFASRSDLAQMENLLLEMMQSLDLPSSRDLKPLVQPFQTNHMNLWLRDWFIEYVAEVFASKTRPDFWNSLDNTSASSLHHCCVNAYQAVKFWVSKAKLLLEALELPAEGITEHQFGELLFPEGSMDRVRNVLQAFALLSLEVSEDGPERKDLDEAGRCLQSLGLLRQPLIDEVMVSSLGLALEKKLSDFSRVWDTPCLSSLMRWVESEIFVWSSRISPDPKLKERLWRLSLSRFCVFRVLELFDIIVAYPEESLTAVSDLRDCLGLLKDSSGHATAELQNLVARLSESIVNRLLHPGANTSDIIHTYILTIHVLRIIDPSGVTLDHVAKPIRAYLVGRPDTIRCIVQSLTDPEGELFAELAKTDVTTESRDDPDAWDPEPVDGLPQNEGVSKNKDVVELLINIFGGADPFVVELKSLMSQRLLAVTDYNVDAEIRTVELLKLRFGESSLHDCEIMLRDMAESKRINKHVHASTASLENVNAIMVSYLYWPSLPTSSEQLVVPATLKPFLESYQKAYGELKATRKLDWNLALGDASLDIETPSGQLRSFTGVSYASLAVLELFQNNTSASPTLDDIASALKVSREAARRAVAFWRQHGLMIESNDGTIRFSDSTTEAEMGGAIEGDDDMDIEDDQDWSVVEPFVLHMLSNLGPMTLVQIHDQLKNFADEDKPLAELKGFLTKMCQDDKVTLKDGQYHAVASQ